MLFMEVSHRFKHIRSTCELHRFLGQWWCGRSLLGLVGLLFGYCLLGSSDFLWQPECASPTRDSHEAKPDQDNQPPPYPLLLESPQEFRSKSVGSMPALTRLVAEVFAVPLSNSPNRSKVSNAHLGGSKLRSSGYAGFSLCFHLPRGHFGF